MFDKRRLREKKQAYEILFLKAARKIQVKRSGLVYKPFTA
jgi:hypothetical protein